MTDTTRDLIQRLADMADALDGRKPLVFAQGQTMDGFTALANFQALANEARAYLSHPEPEVIFNTMSKLITQEHSITPPPELVQQWIKKCDQPDDPRWQEYEQDIANHAAEWGYDQRGEVNEAELQKARDQELEACCALMDDWGLDGNDLMECRRPKPPSLKEQALKELNKVDMLWATEEFGQETLNSLDTIRRALEALPDD